MIRDKDKAMAICDSFGDYTGEQKKELEKKHLTQYLFYSSITGRKNNQRSCYCTACKAQFMENIYTTEAEFIHKQFTVCPVCGAHVKAFQDWRGKQKLYERKNIMVLEARNEALFIRIFDIRHWWVNSLQLLACDEKWRIYVAPGMMQKFEKDCYSEKFLRIGNDNALKIDIDGIIGRAEIDRTFLRYFDVWKYFDNPGESYWPSFVWMKYIFTAAKKPNIEYLDKLGMKRLICDILDGNMKLIRWKSNNVKIMLGLDKTELELCEWNATRLRFHHEMIKRNIRDRATVHSILRGKKQRFYNEYLDKLIDIAKRLPDASLAKIHKYAKASYYRAVDWMDYLIDLGKPEVGGDLTDTSMTFPKDLQAAKDRVRELIRTKADEKINEKVRQRAESLKKYVYSDDRFTLVIPQSVQEIVNEGKALSHCVGSYAYRHATGGTTILFLREKDDLQTPFYTIEINLDKPEIVQCRGYKNNRANNPKPQEIKDFEKSYETFLMSMSRKNKRVNQEVKAS